MKFSKEQLTAVTVHTVFEGDQSGDLQQLHNRKLFSGKPNTTYAMLNVSGEGTIYYGLGKEDEINPYLTTTYFHHLGKYLEKMNLPNVHLTIPSKIQEDSEMKAKVFEGLYQAEYKYNEFKKSKKEAFELTVSVERPDDMEASFITVEHVVKGAFVARDFVNQPSNQLYPETYAAQIVDLFKDTNVSVEVYDEKQIEELGMEAFLTVAKGSNRAPRLIVMKYMPLDQEEHITIVGKGMTYDSGGYAIKSTAGMVNMKSDMAGSAAVVGALYALEKVGVQQNVVGVIAAAENMIDGKAMKNGDIIGSLKGTTIEVNNTDAEGRLTLADAIYYAATELKSTEIVDLATLTGAAIAALGPNTTAMISNNDDLADAVLDASEKGCEPTHRLPAFPSHYKMIKGQFGELNNAPKGGGGAITAGIFLEHFAEGLPWVHLDIAGPSFGGKPFDYLPAGASGTGVKTLYRWIAAK